MGVCFQAEVVDPVFEFSFFFPVSPLWSVPPSSPPTNWLQFWLWVEWKYGRRGRLKRCRRGFPHFYELIIIHLI